MRCMFNYKFLTLREIIMLYNYLCLSIELGKFSYDLERVNNNTLHYR